MIDDLADRPASPLFADVDPMRFEAAGGWILLVFATVMTPLFFGAYGNVMAAVFGAPLLLVAVVGVCLIKHAGRVSRARAR